MSTDMAVADVRATRPATTMSLRHRSPPVVNGSQLAYPDLLIRFRCEGQSVWLNASVGREAAAEFVDIELPEFGFDRNDPGGRGLRAVQWRLDMRGKNSHGWLFEGSASDTRVLEVKPGDRVTIVGDPDNLPLTEEQVRAVEDAVFEFQEAGTIHSVCASRGGDGNDQDDGARVVQDFWQRVADRICFDKNGQSLQKIFQAGRRGGRQHWRERFRPLAAHNVRPLERQQDGGTSQTPREFDLTFPPVNALAAPERFQWVPHFDASTIIATERGELEPPLKRARSVVDDERSETASHNHGQFPRFPLQLLEDDSELRVECYWRALGRFPGGNCDEFTLRFSLPLTPPAVERLPLEFDHYSNWDGGQSFGATTNFYLDATMANEGSDSDDWSDTGSGGDECSAGDDETERNPAAAADFSASLRSALLAVAEQGAWAEELGTGFCEWNVIDTNTVDSEEYDTEWSSAEVLVYTPLRFVAPFSRHQFQRLPNDLKHRIWELLLCLQRSWGRGGVPRDIVNRIAEFAAIADGPLPEECILRLHQTAVMGPQFGYGRGSDESKSAIQPTKKQKRVVQLLARKLGVKRPEKFSDGECAAAQIRHHAESFSVPWKMGLPHTQPLYFRWIPGAHQRAGEAAPAARAPHRANIAAMLALS